MKKELNTLQTPECGVNKQNKIKQDIGPIIMLVITCKDSMKEESKENNLTDIIAKLETEVIKSIGKEKWQVYKPMLDNEKIADELVINQNTPPKVIEYIALSVNNSSARYRAVRKICKSLDDNEGIYSSDMFDKLFCLWKEENFKKNSDYKIGNLLAGATSAPFYIYEEIARNAIWTDQQETAIGQIANDAHHTYPKEVYQNILDTLIKRAEKKGFYEALDLAKIILGGKFVPCDILEQAFDHMQKYTKAQSCYQIGCQEAIVHSENEGISVALMQRASKSLATALKEQKENQAASGTRYNTPLGISRYPGGGGRCGTR